MCHRKNMAFAILCCAFVIVSFWFINPYPNNSNENIGRTSTLKKAITKAGDQERIDYVDENNNPAYASDAGYATMIITGTKDNKIEKYYDEKGEACSKPEGNYGVAREYDEKGNNVRVSFLGMNDELVDTTFGYAIEIRTYNSEGRIEFVHYYDSNEEPVCSTYYGYGRANEYDENGNLIRITYLDKKDSPMIAGIGYAQVSRTFYMDGKDSGRVENEFYYDNTGKSMALSLGQYGVIRGYDEKGENTIVTYLGADGKPTVTSLGYTTVVRGYYSTYSTERYYDVNGNPVALSEGQYGIKRENGKISYLDSDGQEQFNLKNTLHYQSQIVIVIAVTVILISAFTSKRFNALLLIGNLFVIGYLTLMYREKGDSRSNFQFFDAIIKLVTNDRARADAIKNIWLFIPFGTILYKLYPQYIILLVPLIISAFIELTQFATGIGLCELGDIISNGLGGVIGYYSGKILTIMIHKIRIAKRLIR